MQNLFEKSFYSLSNICVESTDNFFIDKRNLNLEKEKESVLFSVYMHNKLKFSNKTLLSFSPKLVIQTVEEEFQKKLNKELMDVIIKDFNMPGFKDFELPIVEEDAFISKENDKKINDPHANAIANANSNSATIDVDGDKKTSITPSENNDSEQNTLSTAEKFLASQKPTESKIEINPYGVISINPKFEKIYFPVDKENFDPNFSNENSKNNYFHDNQNLIINKKNFYANHIENQQNEDYENNYCGQEVWKGQYIHNKKKPYYNQNNLHSRQTFRKVNKNNNRQNTQITYATSYLHKKNENFLNEANNTKNFFKNPFANKNACYCCGSNQRVDGYNYSIYNY